MLCIITVCNCWTYQQIVSGLLKMVYLYGGFLLTYFFQTSCWTCLSYGLCPNLTDVLRHCQPYLHCITPCELLSLDFLMFYIVCTF